MELDWNIIHFKGVTEKEIAQQFANHLSAQSYCFYRSQSALYILTNNAGSYSSIAFWANALEYSPRFANPANFPWTLANATSGYIAREFLIEGPNYTFINKTLDTNQLLDQYQSDLKIYPIKNSLLISWNITSFNPLSVQVKYVVINRQCLESPRNT